MRFVRASLTSVSPLSDAIGHNNPRCSVQVVGDSLHDVLCVRLGQPHISCHPGPEPPVHRTVCPFHGIAYLAYGLVHGPFAFRETAVLLRLVHDAAFQPHGGKRLPVLRRVVALVCHHGSALFQARLLQRRVSDKDLWIRSFHRWMLAATAQWTGSGDRGRRANSVAPLLISTVQGLGKSTFCRMLLPDELRDYFTESFDLTNASSAENKLASYGLINLDEFDRLPASRMPQLKNLMQMEDLRDCSCTAFSRLLAQMGRRVHTRYGNGYWVRRI